MTQARRATYAAAFAALLSLATGPALARDLILNQPIDCTLGVDCFIHDHVDLDPSEGKSDFTCGSLTRNGHKGTDFALLSLADIDRGVNVLAAAPGTVVGTRDIWPDIRQRMPGAPDVTGQECGNGVGIRHGGGWFTQYCHMKKDSIVVKPGDRVAKGSVLGEVGLSGKTTYPHLHFDVRKDRDVIDPFHPTANGTCTTEPVQSLWQTPLEYVPAGLIRAGLIGEIPEFEDIKASREASGPIPPDASVLIIWTYAYGGLAGDEISLEITGPDGTFFSTEVTIEKAQGQLLRYGGRSARAGWTPGPYSGTVTYRREDVILDEIQVTGEVVATSP